MVVLVRSYFCKKGEEPEEKTCYSHEITKEILSEWGVEKLGSITKLFLDYDCNVEGKSPEWIAQEKKAIKNLLIEHATHYAHGFVFTETKQHDKISFHIIFKRIAIDRTTFHPELERELFSKILGEHRFKYPDIDATVYHRKLWFRLPYGTVLPDKPYPHMPYYENALSEYIVSLPDDTDVKSYELHPYTINKKYKELVEKYKYDAIGDEEDNLTARQERITHYLQLIKPERFINHKEWFQLMCLCKGNSIPHHIFLDLSQKSGYNKFNKDQCIKQFDALTEKKTFGFPLLHKWLEEDGVDWKSLYPSLSPIVRAVKNLEINDFGCTDLGLATVLFNFYKGHMYYTASHGWIHWNGKKWDIGNESSIFYPICQLLSNELKTYIEAQRTIKTKQLEAIQAKPKEEQNQLEIQKIELELIQKNDAYKRYRSIQTVKTIKNVLQMSISLFRNDSIIDQFDTKPYLFSFDDVSVDLRTGEIIPITKEQYILTTCGYSMPTRNQDHYDTVKTLLESIAGDTIHSFLQNIAIFLYGGNMNECFSVWTGRGRNGKGVVDHMLKRVLGKYYQDIPITELTEDSKGQGRTSSEIANCRWARCVMATEPEKGCKLKTGRIKQYTGNDRINARQLYKEAFSFAPNFSLGIQCNEIPQFSKMDDALQKRMLITEFPFQFVEHPERDYQRQRDDTIKTKINETDVYRNGLFYVLLDVFIKTQGKIIRTSQTEEKLDEVIADNSPLEEFLRSYEKTTCDFIRFNDLYTTYTANYAHIKKSQFKDLILELKIKTEEDKSHGLKIFLKKVC